MTTVFLFIREILRTIPGFFTKQWFSILSHKAKVHFLSHHIIPHTAFLYFILLISGCGNGSSSEAGVKPLKKYRHLQPSDTVSYLLPAKLENTSPYFQPGIDSVFGSYYLYYLTNRSELVFRPVFRTGPEFRLQMGPFLSTAALVKQIVVKDSMIYSLVPEKHVLYRLEVSSDLQIKSVDSLDFSRQFDRSNLFIRESLEQPFQVWKGRYLIPVGSMSKRRKFVDPYAYIIVEKRGEEIAVSTVMESPEEYRSGLRKGMKTLVIGFQDRLIYTFQDIDRIHTLDEHMKITSSFDFNPYSDYEAYDYDRRRDLGYVRKYGSTNELVMKYLVSGSSLVAIKRIRKKHLHDPSTFEYIFIDSNFQIKSIDSSSLNVRPELSFAYRNGIMLTDRSLAKGYFYEIP